MLPIHTKGKHPESQVAVGTGFGQLFRGLGRSSILQLNYTHFFDQVKPVG